MPARGAILFDGADIQDNLVDYKANVGYVPEEAHNRCRAPSPARTR